MGSPQPTPRSGLLPDVPSSLCMAPRVSVREALFIERERGKERGVCLLKGNAEGTYKTKHAEAARLDYRTTYRHTGTHRHAHGLLEGLCQAQAVSEGGSVVSRQRAGGRGKMARPLLTAAPADASP